MHRPRGHRHFGPYRPILQGGRGAGGGDVRGAGVPGGGGGAAVFVGGGGR